MSSERPIDPEAAAAILRVRKLMLVASLTTLVAVGAVLAVIGYRVFHWQGSGPAGAKVLSSAVGDGHFVITVDVDGEIELRTFDLATLKPLARVRLGPAKEGK